MGIRRTFAAKLRLKACELVLVGEHEGITLCNADPNGTCSEEFIDYTSRAIDLVRDYDPKRYARIRRHVSYIYNTNMRYAGSYCPGHICMVNCSFYNFRDHPQWYLCMFASMLVHEATHGYLRAKGFGRTRSNWEQVERICVTEENRFLANVESPWGDKLRVEFDPDAWRRASRLGRIRSRVSRLKGVVPVHQP